MPEFLEPYTGLVEGDAGPEGSGATLTAKGLKAPAGSSASISSDVSLAASLYKQFFRDLPVPVIPYAVYRTLMRDGLADVIGQLRGLCAAENPSIPRGTSLLPPWTARALRLRCR